MTRDRAAETAAEHVARREHEHDVGAMQRVLATPEGRRVLWWLLGQAGTYDTSYVRGDVHETVFREGQRTVGIALEARIHEADAEALIRMQTDALEAARRRRNALEDERAKDPDSPPTA